MNSNLKLSVCCLAIGAALSTPALAQQESETSIERITVTSDFRELTVDQLPASASIITAEGIEQRQASFLDEILNSAPNVNFNSGAGRGRYVQIRGIGERSQFSEPLNPSVGFFVDDIDFSGAMGIGTLFDVEQVEVLKGPQGTTFGSSALAGVIKLKTAEADGVESGKLSASIAEQSSYNLAGAYGNSINDKWNFRIAVQQYKSDGYITNTFLNRDDTDDIDELTSRLKLRYEASDDLTLDFAIHYYDVDNGYDAFSLDNVRETLSDEPGFDRQETLALSAKANWQLDGFNLIASVSTSDSDLDYGYDEDWTFTGFHPNGYTSTDHYFRTRDTNNLDVRLVSDQPMQVMGKASDWVAGFYIKSTDESLLREYTFDSDFTSDYSLDNIALYGEIYPQLSDKLTLTLGLRLERASIDYSDISGFSDEEDETFVGGRIVLDYQVTDDSMIYASINRGYKLGGFNTDPRVPQGNIYYDGELNWNYEVGSKRYFDGLGDSNRDSYVGFSLFYMDRENTHVSDFIVESIGDTGASSFVDVIANADLGTNYGAEIETLYQFSNSLEVFANIGLLQASFEDYINVKGELIPEQDQAQAPSHMLNIGFNLDFLDHWRLTVETDSKADYRFSDGHDVTSGSTNLWHFNVNRQWGDWKLSVWGQNIFDKDYFVRGFGGFSNDPRDGEFGYDTPEPYLQYGDGRKLGVTVDYVF